MPTHLEDLRPTVHASPASQVQSTTRGRNSARPSRRCRPTPETVVARCVERWPGLGDPGLDANPERPGRRISVVDRATGRRRRHRRRLGRAAGRRADDRHVRRARPHLRARPHPPVDGRCRAPRCADRAALDRHTSARRRSHRFPTSSRPPCSWNRFRSRPGSSIPTARLSRSGRRSGIRYS